MILVTADFAAIQPTLCIIEALICNENALTLLYPQKKITFVNNYNVVYIFNWRRKTISIYSQTFGENSRNFKNSAVT